MIKFFLIFIVLYSSLMSLSPSSSLCQENFQYGHLILSNSSNLWKIFKGKSLDDIQFILENDFDLTLPDPVLVSIIERALEAGNLDVFSTIVERDPYLKIPGSSFIHIAVKMKSLLLLDLIYDYQPDVNIKDKDGRCLCIML